MIRECTKSDFKKIFEIINDAAQAYKGIIPEDRWHESYMPLEELRKEIEHGVVFWGLEHDGQLLGVMGIQDKGEVTLIRHAYVWTQAQKLGIGTKLLKYLEGLTDKPILIGTWAAASWAISFYEKNGYTLVSEEEKNCLLRKFWSIPERQVETSVVLANRTWNNKTKELLTNPPGQTGNKAGLVFRNALCPGCSLLTFPCFYPKTSKDTFVSSFFV